MAKRRDVQSSVRLRELALIAGPAVVITIFAFWFAFQFVEPAPPNEITISTGSKTGAYYGFAKSYAEELSKAGIKVNILTSSGSLENLKRLKEPGGPVELALLQGGVTDKSSDVDGLVSLGRIFPEPLWVFHTQPEKLKQLSALSGQRIAIGPEGSGTRKLALALLAPNAITAQNTTLSSLGGDQAADALLRGELDAIFLTTAPEAPLIKKLLADPRSQLMSFDQGEAYTRIFPYLVRVSLPRGVIDLVKNVPSEDITLVAPKAALVARDSLHPAIVGLLVDAAKAIHSEGGMFHRVGEYPETVDPEFTMSDDAVRFYQQGEPWLQSFLPFWLAIFIERMIVMLLPIATILIPLVKIVPFVYELRLKSRIMYWYGQLKGIEKELQASRTNEELENYLSEIVDIEESVSAIPMPLHYSDRFYELRGAVDLVRQRVEKRLAGAQKAVADK